MINVIKEQIGDVLHLLIVGVLDESSDLPAELGDPAPKMNIHCREIQRINSIGVKQWISYFLNAKKAGSQLTFSECSVAIVEQNNLIANFLAGGTMESFYVPYSCTRCGTELLGLFKVSDFNKDDLRLPEVKCTKCGSPAVFDDILEEYFYFLIRS